jgi:hypothetical protein
MEAFIALYLEFKEEQKPDIKYDILGNPWEWSSFVHRYVTLAKSMLDLEVFDKDVCYFSSMNVRSNIYC